MRNKVIFLFLVLIGFLASVPRPAFAQEVQPTPSDNEVNRVAKQMYCPVCENIPLDVCPTQACSEWRELIRLKLSEGWTDEQIKEYFVAQYGDRVLAEPPRRGLNWLVYILPGVFFAAGLVILWRVLTNMQKKKIPVAPAAGDSGPDLAEDRYLKELEEELKNNP